MDSLYDDSTFCINAGDEEVKKPEVTQTINWETKYNDLKSEN